MKTSWLYTFAADSFHSHDASPFNVFEEDPIIVSLFEHHCYGNVSTNTVPIEWRMYFVSEMINSSGIGLAVIQFLRKSVLMVRNLVDNERLKIRELSCKSRRCSNWLCN